MGELLARVAQPEDEARWMECAESRTVRQVRELVVQALSEVQAARGAEVDAHAADGVTRTCEGSDACVTDDERKGDDVMCTLTCTVDQEDAWLFEATRALLGQLGEHGADAQSQALLGEAQGTLLAALTCSTGESALDDEGWECLETDEQRWLRELARWRAEAEALCEERIGSSRQEAGEPTV